MLNEPLLALGFPKKSFLVPLVPWWLNLLPLFAETQTIEERGITLHIVFFQVIQKTAPVPDQLEQSTAGRMVLGMGFKMLGQVLDPLGNEGNLNFWGTGVRILLFKILNQLGLLFLRHHGAAPQIEILLPDSPVAERPSERTKAKRRIKVLLCPPKGDEIPEVVSGTTPALKDRAQGQYSMDFAGGCKADNRRQKAQKLWIQAVFSPMVLHNIGRNSRDPIH
jgi:hypothetical protein